MKQKLLIYYNRIREQLWFRPFVFCLFSVLGALLAQQADNFGLDDLVPNIETSSIEGLLDTISSSMLVISIFAVASMLSAFSSASSTATPRSFKVVVTDDVSQNALSIFIGAFIFSIVATIALQNGFYEKSGRFTIFLFTLILFAVVILTFLRWVDRISRLGRLEHTISQVEEVASRSLKRYINMPYLKACKIEGDFGASRVIYSDISGYVQNLNLEGLQEYAVANDLKLRIICLPGNFVNENSTLVYVKPEGKSLPDNFAEQIRTFFHIGSLRMYEEDPRFGLIALTEIASRALSPGINDPGTAIQILGSHERLFFLWKEKEVEKEAEVLFDRIEVPEISLDDFFIDAFRPIARDGADNLEVMLRLQKALNSISTIKKIDIQKAAYYHSRQAFERAEKKMQFGDDLQLLKKKCLFTKER